EAVAKAAPDGYTITLSTSAVHATNPSLYAKLPFDAIRGFSHVTFLASAPNMLVVNSTVPANNMAELIAYAKANPGKLTYISAGSGTSPHMSGELLRSMTGIQITHVPYKNITQGFATRTRSALAPEVPPIAETVPGFEIRPWWGVSGPAGMPADVVDKLYNATNAI